jgi:predicted aminopeptidase
MSGQEKTRGRWRTYLGLALATAIGGLAALTGTGCDKEEARYLMQQAPGQLALLMDRVPFKKLLADPNLDPKIRAKLLLVLDVKKYAVETIGLKRNKNYEVFVPLDREAVSWNLTAAQSLSMSPLTWKFPMVGEVPYLGFFKEGDALAKQKELQAQGYDVYVRTAGAYSMLGIVSDPLYSPLLRYRDAELANLVVHEMTHGTVFFKDEMEFNENLALFVGNQGSYNYLVQKFGADSEESRYAIGANEDDVVFGREIMAVFNELDTMFKSSLSDADKMKKKDEIIAAHKKHFRDEVLPAMKTDTYTRWPDKDINNATIISRKVYFHDLTLYDNLYQAHHQDLHAMVDFFKDAMIKKDLKPEQYAKDWLKDHPAK